AGDISSRGIRVRPRDASNTVIPLLGQRSLRSRPPGSGVRKRRSAGGLGCRLGVVRCGLALLLLGVGPGIDLVSLAFFRILVLRPDALARPCFVAANSVLVSYGWGWHLPLGGPERRRVVPVVHLEHLVHRARHVPAGVLERARHHAPD